MISSGQACVVLCACAGGFSCRRGGQGKGVGATTPPHQGCRGLGDGMSRRQEPSGLGLRAGSPPKVPRTPRFTFTGLLSIQDAAQWNALNLRTLQSTVEAFYDLYMPTGPGDLNFSRSSLWSLQPLNPVKPLPKCLNPKTLQPKDSYRISFSPEPISISLAPLSPMHGMPVVKETRDLRMCSFLCM